VFWVMSPYFNVRNILPESGTFLLGHCVYIYIYIYIDCGRYLGTGEVAALVPSFFICEKMSAVTEYFSIFETHQVVRFLQIGEIQRNSMPVIVEGLIRVDRRVNVREKQLYNSSHLLERINSVKELLHMLTY
jgi:hypothetical protein